MILNFLINIYKLIDFWWTYWNNISNII